MVVRGILYIGITILVPTLLACKTVKAYRVIRVIDGDTIKVEYNGKSETIRLIGVDTPETVHPRKPVEPYGKEATVFTRNLLLFEESYPKSKNC